MSSELSPRRRRQTAGLLILGSAVAAIAAACAGSSAAPEASAPAAPTATAVAGRVTASMNPRCVAAGGGAELRVDFSAGATGEKRLVNFQVRVNGEAIFDSGPIDQLQLRGSRSLSMVPGSSNTVEVIAMPQDGRSATARKQVGCPGTRPGFRAVTQAAGEDGL